jgi:uridine kinase
VATYETRRKIVTPKSLKILFALGLILRFLFIGVKGATYLNDLFIPFLDNAVTHLTSNPWTLSPPQSFPYGVVLYAILFLPRLIAVTLFGNSVLGAGYFGIALVKLPLMAFDWFLLKTLLRLCPMREKQVFIYYWLNPIVIYISYVYGQLDVVVASLTLVSLFQLMRNKVFKSALTMAAATLCKFHVVLLVPFILVFIWNRNFAKNAVKKIAVWSGVWSSLTIVGFLPLILANRFVYATVGSPEALRLFSMKIQLSSHDFVFIGFFLILIVLGRLCLSTRISREGLLFGSAALMTCLIIPTEPMPGWYFWIIPFVTLLLAKYSNVPKSFYWMFQFSYFFFFCFAKDQAFFIPELISGIGLTVLQATLCGFLFGIFVLVLKEGAPLGRRARPVQFGLAGDSGAGKNHFSNLMGYLFGQNNTLVVEGDDYHRWERGAPEWDHITHLNPKANHLGHLVKHAHHIQLGMRIFQPHYDHNTGKFTASRELAPTKTVIYQGLHALYQKRLRDALDIKIYLEPSELVRIYWKLKRDIHQRGHSLERVMANIEKRKLDTVSHIVPQKNFADWVIEMLPVGETTVEKLLSEKEIDLAVRYLISNEISVMSLVDKLTNLPNLTLTQEYVPDSLDRISIYIHGSPTAGEIQKVAMELFPNLRHLTRSWREPVWFSGYNGLHQLFTLALIESRFGLVGD